MGVIKLADIVEMNAHSMVKYNDRIDRTPPDAVVELLHADPDDPGRYRERAGRYSPKTASSFVALLRLAEKTLPCRTNQDQRWVIRLCAEDGGHELESGVIVWPPRWPE